jgi:hypothetical protein
MPRSKESYRIEWWEYDNQNWSRKRLKAIKTVWTVNDVMIWSISLFRIDLKIIKLKKYIYIYKRLNIQLFCADAKGQLISKWFFGVVDFLKKTNENKSTWGIIVVKSNSFVHFLVEIDDPKNHFEIKWPLQYLEKKKIVITKSWKNHPQKLRKTQIHFVFLTAMSCPNGQNRRIHVPKYRPPVLELG